MAERILMLALSPTMEEGVITKWVKAVGDSVKQGDVLCEVETDKATMEYESSNEGTLLKITAQEGAHVMVGNTIGVIGEEGEDVQELLKEAAVETGSRKAEAKEKKEATKPEAEEEKAEEAAKPAAAVEKEEGKIRSTPLARRLANEKGVELERIKGTGPEGRITRQDVEKAASRPAAPAPAPAAGPTAAPARGELKEETIPVSQKRQTIARRLSESKFAAPHYYLTLSVMADSLVRAREDLNAGRQERVSLNAFLMKLAAETLLRHPVINSTWQTDTIIRHGTCDIALAMQMPEGLVAPVVRSCESKGIVQIDTELKALVEKARAGKLALEDYEGATFTISNLGAFGIEQFTAIINPPGSAVLAVGQIRNEPVADETNRVHVQQVMKMTLSCDHRVIDGAVGAEFLRDLKEMVEYPVQGLY
jgi:pyruvate dehydrogenase E2 component (dihydrolipoamide acetyltransferase)